MKPADPAVATQLEPLIEPITREFLARHSGPHSTTLEIGCGPGQYRLVTSGRYIGIDVTTEPYRKGLLRTPDVVADACRLPFDAESFDLVFYSNVFHLLLDGTSVLAECLRVLQPGGTIAIFDYSRTTLERLALAYRTTEPGFSAQVCGCADWLVLLEKAGLADATLISKSRLLSMLFPTSGLRSALRTLYFALINAREGSVVVFARKPIPSKNCAQA